MISTKKLIYQIITKIATPPFDVVYPVGSYYETSDTSFNPNTAWGGTWVLETAGKVHVSAGSGYTAGTSGGATTHTHTTGNCTLSLSQIPAHNHNSRAISGTATFRDCASDNHDTVTGWSGICSLTKPYWSGTHDKLSKTASSSCYQNVLTINATHTHDSQGGGGAHNHGNTGSASNMQPYIAVNRWHRTA